MIVGVILDMDTDFQPVSVVGIKKSGILEAWNRENPDRAVLVGDEIVRVNDILWHHNSQTFAERIKGQFTASKEQKPGAKSILTLAIQRPRREKETRYASQREDLHRQMYSKEFVAEIPFTGVLPRDPLHRAMGWKLNTSVDWEPVKIEKLRNSGLIYNYNRDHPDAKIFSGDEILQVNKVKWHHSAKTFDERLQAQFAAGQRMEFLKAKGAKNVFTLHIRRPRSVKDDPDPQVYLKQYTVQLNLKDARPLGWKLNASSDTDPITVDKVRSHSLLFEYNEAHPTNKVLPGDTILRVNEFLWHDNTKKFHSRIGKEFERVRPRKGKAPNSTLFSLVMQRRMVQPIEKEWTVTMPAEEGKILGWQLNYTDDEFPVTVAKIRSNGVLFEYNEQNPDTKILPGDVIAKVNDIYWKQDSSAFEKRLNDQYTKSKKNGEISFFIRRPVGVTEDELDLSKPFFKEFTVELPIERGATIGWQLASDSDTTPVQVAKIRGTGTVHNWNEHNPLNDIQVGDRIARVNNVLWHGHAKQFIDRLNVQLEAAKAGKGKASVSLLLQRPWKYQDSESTGDADAGGDNDVTGAGEDDGGVLGASEE